MALPQNTPNYRDQFNRSRNWSNQFTQQIINPPKHLKGIAKGLHNIGMGILAYKQNQRTAEAQRQMDEARQQRMDAFKGLTPGTPEYTQFVQQSVFDPNVDEREAQFYNNQMNFANQLALQRDKRQAESRSSVAGGYDAFAKAAERGSNVPVEQFFDTNEDGTVNFESPRFFKFTREGFEPYSFTGKETTSKSGDQKGFKDKVSNQVHGINMASNVLAKANQLEDLWKNAQDEGILGPESFLAKITGLYELSPDTTDFLSAAEEIGKNLALEYQQAAKALGLQETGTATEGDAQRWASNIADLNPYREDGSRKSATSMQLAWQRIQRVQNNFKNKVANRLLGWRTVKGETEGGKETKVRKLYAYGVKQPDNDMTEMARAGDARGIFIRLNEIAADADIGLEFDPNTDPFIRDAIQYAISKEGKDPGARFDALENPTSIIPEANEPNEEGWITLEGGIRYRVGD